MKQDLMDKLLLLKNARKPYRVFDWLSNAMLSVKRHTDLKEIFLLQEN